MGSLYAHLPCSEVDWALEGTAVCRVVGIGCYGLDIPGWARLQRHLQTAAHLVSQIYIVLTYLPSQS